METCENIVGEILERRGNNWSEVKKSARTKEQ